MHPPHCMSQDSMSHHGTPMSVPQRTTSHGIRIGNTYLDLENIDQRHFLAKIERCYRYPDDAQQFYGCHLMNKKRKTIKHIGIIIL